MSDQIHKKIYYFAVFIFILFIALMTFVVWQIFVPVKNFPINKTFEITKEESGQVIFSKLKEEGYIRNVFFAKVASRFFNRNKFYRGEYVFDKPQSTYNIVFSITSRPPSLAVLIPEGFTKKQVADRLEKYIKRFDKKDFLQKAEEGYLFPETYFFYSYYTNDELLKEFSDRFNQNVLEKLGKLPTKEEIIIASMIEREAKDPEDMKIISGIIRNRLSINMPLQIDATVMYGKGVWKDRVLYRDLRKESEYNTYTKTGLPIAPISNPGLNAISAALFPAKTKYMYYITGRDGKMYYAETHQEHLKNIAKYLR